MSVIYGIMAIPSLKMMNHILAAIFIKKKLPLPPICWARIGA
jgi:hypothetical protein